METKYRIAEHCGNFTIEVLVSERRGYFFWAREVLVWVQMNRQGTTSSHYPAACFTSLEGARARVRQWQAEKKAQEMAPIYHEV